MKLISLFAGIGGFDLGFERAGFETVAVVEKDINCRKLLADKFHGAKICDDVRVAGAKETIGSRFLKAKKILADEYYSKRIKFPKAQFPTSAYALKWARDNALPDCDVITFGFPCQDLSVAGKREGLAGGRSGLFYGGARIIDELKPAYAIFENVPGLLSSDEGRDFARVLIEMGRIGYRGAWRVFDSQWFGVAQRRRRVFGVFTRLDSGAERCAEILSIRESLRGHPPPCREKGEVSPSLTASGVGAGRTGNERTEADFCIIAGCLESRTDGGGFPGTDGACAGHVVPVVARCLGGRAQMAHREDRDTLIPAVAGTLRGGANGHRGYNDPADAIDTMIPAVAGCLQTTANDYSRADSPCADRGMNIVPIAIRTEQTSSNGCGIDESGTSYTLDGTQGQAAFVPVGIGGGADVGYALRADPSRSGDKGEGGMNTTVVAQKWGVRRLTPVECERLQGFPDGWTAGFADSTRYRMLGNAVTVNVAEWIAKRVAREFV